MSNIKNVTEEENCNTCLYSYLDDGPIGSYDFRCCNKYSDNTGKSVDSDMICNNYINDNL